MLDLVIWTLITAVSLFVLDFAIAFGPARKAGATGATSLDPSCHRPKSVTRPKPDSPVMSRKVTDHLDHTALASKSAPIGDVALRSDETRYP